MNENMQSVFEPVLNKDEKIIKVFKPNKAKMFWSYVIVVLFIWLFLAIFALLTISDLVKENGVGNLFYIVIGVWVAVYILVLILFSVFYHFEYKKTYYAYSNKRIIIRHGIIGTDYKSLDIDMIGAVTVNVGIIDKMVRKNTGSLTFGSMASPVGTGAFMFAFGNIENPYEVYKEIKEFIDNKKEGK